MRLFRVLLMCLMVLALPLQGFAAVSKALCHQDLSQPQTQAVVHAHSHEHMDLAQDAAGHDHLPSDMHKDHKCSGCAACCLGASMVGVDTLHPVFTTAAPVQVDGMRVLQSEVTPGSIERPPQALRC